MLAPWRELRGQDRRGGLAGEIVTVPTEVPGIGHHDAAVTFTVVVGDDETEMTGADVAISFQLGGSSLNGIFLSSIFLPFRNFTFAFI